MAARRPFASRSPGVKAIVCYGATALASTGATLTTNTPTFVIGERVYRIRKAELRARMSSRGSITLDKLQGKLTMLEIACHRSDRRGRLSLERLITEHGAGIGLPDLWETLAGLPACAVDGRS